MKTSSRFDEQWARYCERIFGNDPVPQYIDMGRAWFYLGAYAAVVTFADVLEGPEGERNGNITAVLEHILEQTRQIGAELAPELAKPRSPVQ